MSNSAKKILLLSTRAINEIFVAESSSEVNRHLYNYFKDRIKDEMIKDFVKKYKTVNLRDFTVWSYFTYNQWNPLNNIFGSNRQALDQINMIKDISNGMLSTEEFLDQKINFSDGLTEGTIKERLTLYKLCEENYAVYGVWPLCEDLSCLCPEEDKNEYKWIETLIDAVAEGKNSLEEVILFIHDKDLRDKSRLPMQQPFAIIRKKKSKPIEGRNITYSVGVFNHENSVFKKVKKLGTPIKMYNYLHNILCFTDNIDIDKVKTEYFLEEKKVNSEDNK